MSLTILIAPIEDSFVAAAAPVWINATSDLEETTYTITGVADSGGSVQLTVADTTGLIANNVVLIAGCDTDYAYLNGRYNVVGTPGATTFVLDLDYQSGSAGNLGTATIQLDKFSCEITNENLATAAIITHYPPFNLGEATKDISRTVCGQFIPSFDITAGWHDEYNKTVIPIETNISEATLAADYSRVTLGTEQRNWYAVQSTMITGRLLENDSYNKLLNGTTNFKVHAGTPVIMSMLTSLGDVSAYSTYMVGATSYPVDTDFIGDVKGYFVFIPVANSTGIELYIRNLADDRISEKLYITLLPGCSSNVYPLYWKNHYGGYDVYEFTDKTETIATGNRQEIRGFLSTMGNLIDKDFSTESWQEVKLTGRPEPQAQVEYLRDLVVSPEIYNVSGERVKILSTSFTTNSRDNVTPEITILVNREGAIW